MRLQGLCSRRDRLQVKVIHCCNTDGRVDEFVHRQRRLSAVLVMQLTVSIIVV